MYWKFFISWHGGGFMGVTICLKSSSCTCNICVLSAGIIPAIISFFVSIRTLQLECECYCLWSLSHIFSAVESRLWILFPQEELVRWLSRSSPGSFCPWLFQVNVWCCHRIYSLLLLVNPRSQKQDLESHLVTANCESVVLKFFVVVYIFLLLRLNLLR